MCEANAGEQVFDTKECTEAADEIMKVAGRTRSFGPAQFSDVPDGCSIRGGALYLNPVGKCGEDGRGGTCEYVHGVTGAEGICRQKMFTSHSVSAAQSGTGSGPLGGL